MKKFLFLFSLLSLAALSFSQITLESGAQLIVSSGSTVIANDGIVNNDGSIDNDGTVEIKGDLENNTSALLTSGSTGTVKFNGSSAQKITGTADAGFYGTVEIDNSTGVSIDTTAAGNGSSQTINGTLAFTTGLFTLNWFDLTLAADATGAAAGKYVQTDSIGVVKRTVAASDIIFPVGNSAYNPVTLNNAGTSDTYNVRVIDADPLGGATTHYVDRSWIITEGVASGSDLTVTPQWNSAEEDGSFDRTNSSVGLTAGGATVWGETGAATGSDPYSIAGTSFTEVDTFAVGDYYYSGKRLDLKLFLAGAYNGTTMDKDLNTASLIPTTDPYGLSGDPVTVPTDAVDWVKVQLRDATDSTLVLHQFPFFVDVNGDLLDTDGNAGGKITGFDNAVPYYIAVMHRNHMGIMTASTLDLSVASPTYDYTTAQAQAWDNAAITTNNAMKDVSGVFCLWDGDANGNGSIVYNGGGSDRVEILDDVGGVSNMSTVISTVYYLTDINLDGNVVYNGGSSDRVKILDNVGGVSNMSTVLNAHLP